MTSIDGVGVSTVTVRLSVAMGGVVPGGLPAVTLAVLDSALPSSMSAWVTR